MNGGNVFVQETVDRGPWVFWDRLETAAGSTSLASYQFFATAIGGSKTKVDTNMIQANRLPPPEAFHVHCIGFLFGPQMLLVDITTFLKQYYFEFKIGGKVFAEGPLHLFPGGAGLSGIAATTATTVTYTAYNNGLPTVAATRRFPDYPRIIPANVYFGVEVKGTTFTVDSGGNGLDLMCVLDGIFDREVQ